MSIAVDIRRKAMDFLARREHSQGELCDKLARSFEDKQLVITVVEQLAQEGLQSDQRFAESFTRLKAAAGYGPIRIRVELLQRRVNEHTADAAIRAGAYDWMAQLESVWQKKFPGLPEDARERARQQRFLYYRGFPTDLIQELLS